MPKHASDSHLEFSSAKKRKRDSHNLTRDLGPMNMEKTERSVREKLFAGIAIGFKKAQNQQQQEGQQQQAAHNGQSFYEVATLQDSLDEAFRVNPRILQTINSPSQSQTVMFPAEEEEEEEYQKPHPSGRSDIILDHLCRRIDQRGEPLDSAPVQPAVETEFRASLGRKEGNIAIYECDVPDELGHVTTWLWFKICRPLTSNEQLTQFVAPDMSEDPEAWNIVAIPKSQVTMVQSEYLQSNVPSEMTNGDDSIEGTEPAQLKKISVRMRYSRDGVPSMAYSDEKGEICWAWTDFRPDLYEEQWNDIYGDMADNSCLVYAFSKPGVEWFTVSPGRPQQPKRSSGGGVRRSSRLKQEVHLED